MGLISAVSGFSNVFGSLAKNSMAASNAARKAIVNTVQNTQKAVVTNVQNAVKANAANVQKATETAKKAGSATLQATTNVVKNTAKVAVTYPKTTAAVTTGALATAAAVATQNVTNVRNTVQEAANYTGKSASEILGGAGATVSNGITQIDQMREANITNAATLYANGNVAGAVAVGGASLAAEVILPLDAISVGNKLATGQEVTTEEWIYAGIDVACLALIPFTGGLSLAAKTGKTAIKGGTKTMGFISGGAKLANAISEAKSANKIAAKLAAEKKTALKLAKKSKNVNTISLAESEYKIAKQAAKTQANVYKSIKSGAKSVKSGSTLTKATSSTLGKTLKAGTVGGLLGAGAFGLGSFLTSGGGSDDTGILDDTGLYDDGFNEDAYTGTDDGSLLSGMDDWADSVMGSLSDVPVIGDVAEEIEANGLSLPVIVIIIIAIAAVIYHFAKSPAAKPKKSKKGVAA